MRVAIFPGAAEVARVAADVVGEVAAEVAGEKRQPLLALPTGRTAVPFYAELARRFAAGALDLSKARSFNLDELLLPREHPETFRAYMVEHAWARIGLDPRRCAIPDSAPADPEEECRHYEQALRAAGPFDLVVLGVGTDGHVAYNLPGAVIEQTHVVELPERIAERLSPPVPERPLRAITMGLGPMRSARRLMLLATGESKARAVAALVWGREDVAWPCSLLRGHPSFDVILDRAAAGR